MLCIKATIEEYTTPDPITADANMTIDTLSQLMNRHGIRHLPVLRSGKVVGVISERDLHLVSGLNVAEKMQVLAADIMSPDPVSVSANTPLDQVAYLMSDKKIGSLIVNDDEGNFLGIFTATDALNALIEILRGAEVLRSVTTE